LTVRALQGVIRNFSVVALAQAITWTATFVFTIAQARYLGPARFGELSVALSWTILLTVVVDFGLSTKLARDVAQRPVTGGQALAATLAIRLALWCLVMPLVWAMTILLAYDSELQGAVLILAGSLLFSSFAASLGAYFQGREEFLVPSLGSIAQRGSAAVLGVVALALGYGVLVVAGVYVVASLAQILAMVPGLMKRPPASLSLERATIIQVVSGTAMLGFFWILGAVYYNVDMVILQRLVPAENVAWYAAAYRLFNAALMLVGFASSTVLYPVLSRLSVGPRQDLRYAMERSFTFLLASGVFVALVLAVAADQVVAVLYPAREYGEAATALRLLAPGIAATYTNGVFFLSLLGMGFERRLLVMAAVLAVLNPLANVVGIPLLQQNASALLTSATEGAVLLWVIALTPPDLRGAANPRIIARIALAAVPAGGLMWLMREQSIFMSVPFAGAVYLAAAVLLGVVPASDFGAARSLLRAWRPAPEQSIGDDITGSAGARAQVAD
jgi:O-antigen/teichoic acid export membrane protein